jgi:hypothetical protein
MASALLAFTTLKKGLSVTGHGFRSADNIGVRHLYTVTGKVYRWRAALPSSLSVAATIFLVFAHRRQLLHLASSTKNNLQRC